MSGMGKTPISMLENSHGLWAAAANTIPPLGGIIGGVSISPIPVRLKLAEENILVAI